MNISEDLLQRFYLGRVSEDEKLAVEDALLSSSAVVLEFIAVKRSFEELRAPLLNPLVKEKIREKLQQSSPLSWNLLLPKRWWAQGTLALAGLAVLGFFFYPMMLSAPPKMVKTTESKSWSVDSATHSALNLNYL